MEVIISEKVQEALANLGRSEDVKLSPNERCLAITGYFTDSILLIDITFDYSGNNKKITLSDCVVVKSLSLHMPHGLAFINDETLVVANRRGDVVIFSLPPMTPSTTLSENTEINVVKLEPIVTLGGEKCLKVSTPGSLSISKMEGELYELLVCNNYTHYVSRHILDGKNGFNEISSTYLLRHKVDVPDGIATDKKVNWIAISNHNTQNILMFKNSPQLNCQSTPDGILTNITCPHGIRFTADDNYILVADAGQPYIHVYAENEEEWFGEREPITSIRVMDDEIYQRVKHDPQESGTKGLDTDKSMKVLITTSQHVTLDFFDLEEALAPYQNKQAPSQVLEQTSNMDNENDLRSVFIRELERENYLHNKHEAYLNDSFANTLEENTQSFHQTLSWRVTAPLRWVRRRLNL